MTELTDGTVRADLAEQAATIVARYPEGRSRSALLPMLHLVQSVDGYVSPEGIAFCAEQLGITKAEVAAVATFYTMYKRRPTGEYLVSVCTNTMCGVLGGDKAYEALSAYLEVGHDQTTEDGRITLEHAECLAACDYAPVMTVNYEYFDQVDAESALTLVKQLQDGERPVPTRGARLCSFKEMSRQLAGFEDNRSAVADPMVGIEPTVAGNRLAEERGVSVPGFFPNTPIAKKADKAETVEKGGKPTPTKAAPAPAAAAPAPTAPADKAAPADTGAPAEKAAAAVTDEGPKTADPAGDQAAPADQSAPAPTTASAPAPAGTADQAAPAAQADLAGPAGPSDQAAPASQAAASGQAAQAGQAAEPPAAVIPAQPTDGADPDAGPAGAHPADAASPTSSAEEKPAPRTRRRSSGPLVSASAEPAKRRPANKTAKAPAKRGGTRRPTTRDPETERSAPAVERADAAPAQPATEPQIRDVETPTNPAETSPTVPEPAADSKPAGDAPPTDPRTENDSSEGQK